MQDCRPHPDIWNPKLHFNMILRWFMCTLNFEVHCPKEFHVIKNFITLLKQSNIVGYLPVLQASRIIQIFLDRQKFSDTIKCMRNVGSETRIKLMIKADSRGMYRGIMKRAVHSLEMIWCLFTSPMCISHSIVSDSLWPHGPQPAKLLSPWNSPGRNTTVGCHFLLHSLLL